MVAPPVLETARLVLRLPNAEDADRFVDYFSRNRRHLKPWSAPRPKGFYTSRFWRDRLPFALTELEHGSAVRFILFKRNAPEGPIIGDANLSQIARGPFQACYLGYSLDEAHLGQGLMTEALTAIVDYAFEELHLHRVMANYIPTNERSGRLLERLGFTVEGYAKNYLFIDGAWRDHVLTARTNDAFADETIMNG